MAQGEGLQRLQEELAALYLGNLNTVEADLVLPTEGRDGSRLRWESSEERFITTTGEVHRPLHGMGNRQVTLRVTAEAGGETASRTFSVTVLQQSRETVVREVRPIRLHRGCGCRPKLPSVAIVHCADGRLTTMPVSWQEEAAKPFAGGVRVPGQLRREDTGETAAAVTAEIFDGKESPEEETPRLCRRYLPMQEVRLLPGSIYAQAQERMGSYLLAQDPGQLLYNFRRAAGLDTRGAQPMTGWDAEDCLLKGHTTGHYLSGCALAYAATGDERFREKLDILVEGLAECQQAFEGQEGFRPGFLSAYSEEQFDLLEKFTKYPAIWAPYYTLDKLMSGLYDCHVLAGNPTAREIVSRMGDWVYARLSRLPQPVLDRMWSMYIAGEFGGMYGTMAKLYALTGKEEHLRAARLFYNEKLFYPMGQNCDTLEDMHANQHIPQILGCMDEYAVTGAGDRYRIAKNFWDIVTQGHTYLIGGVGETEMFHRAGHTCDYLTDKAAESCASYNLLRLTGQLYAYTGDGRMMDYYENTLLNHTMGTASREEDGGTTYFFPLSPGGRKSYDTEENTCCHGTGMESRFRYQGHIFSRDEKQLYCNLLIDCELRGEGALRIQHRDVGEEPWEVLRFEALRDMSLCLAIRVPGWAASGFRLLRQGQPCACHMDAGFACLDEPLRAGEQVELWLPLRLRVIPADDPAYACLAYGPHLLAALSEEKGFLPLPELSAVRQTAPLRFQAGELTFVPLSSVDDEAYHVYLRNQGIKNEEKEDKGK